MISEYDIYDREWVDNVRPRDWKNPDPAPRYNLVVIGAGTAGLVTAAGAAGLGAKVALIEKHFMGGDCLNYGCVPSKTLLHEANRGGMDFAKVMERVRAVRANISHHDSAARFKSLGVDVFLGDGRFLDSNTIEVAGAKLKFRRAVIATGARAAIPEVAGVEASRCYTNETIFSLTVLPKRLAVIGGGPIGCELAQAFQRLGSRVTLYHKHAHLLDREDPDAAAVVQRALARDGVELLLNSGSARIDADAVLLSAGRVPNVEGLNLDTAGVQYDSKRGVAVDDHLRTTNRNVYAAGDVCMNWKFTHAADFAARIVIQNTLFGGRKKLSALTMPWCTYTDPEVAHVGAYERDGDFSTFTREMKDVDRARTDHATDGFVKIHVRRGTDRIVGATIVAPHAGDMISEISVAMAGGVGLGRLASVIHPYPTQAEAIRQCGDAYNRTRLTPAVKKLFAKWLAWTR